MTELVFGIQLKADASGLRGEVRLSKRELDKLGKAGQEAGRKMDGFGAKLAASLKAVGPRLRRLGRQMSLSITAPIVGAATAVAKFGAGFDESLAKIVGLVGVNRDQVNAWRGDLLKLGTETGQGPGALAEALFFVTSAGARGGVVTKPVVFPMRQGAGLMGEAGPEAIMPLARLPGGDLGVKAGGGGGTAITIIDQRGASAPPIESRERRGPNGERMIDIRIHDAVNRGLATGAFDSRLSADFGLGRAGNRR